PLPVGGDAGASFTVGPNNYFLDSVDMAMRDINEIGNFSVELWSNSGSGLPGTQLLIGSPGPVSTTASVITVDFGGTFELQANTTYWIVADAQNGFKGMWHRRHDEYFGDLAWRAHGTN